MDATHARPPLTATQWAVISVILGDAKAAESPRAGLRPSLPTYRFIGSERKLADRMVARGLIVRAANGTYTVTADGHRAYAASASPDDGWRL